jgi:hypothetical protein
VPETLPAEVLEKMHAAPKPDGPVISAADLPAADGFIFGFPTRWATETDALLLLTFAHATTMTVQDQLCPFASWCLAASS